jgi:nucleotide-binding universal stress UspA family protein
MSEFREYMIRRILVGLDASNQSLAALDEAVEMAEALKAEILGIFVEDIDLLRSAGYPFSRRVLFPSGAFEAIDTPRLERELQARAEQARSALEAAAEKRHRPWTFQCVRGSVSALLLEAAGTVDVVTLGRSGWAASRSTVLGSTARVLARNAPGAILIVEKSHSAHDPVQAVYDGSTASARVVRTAASYAVARGLALVVHVLGATAEEYTRRVEQVRDIADHRFKHIQVQKLTTQSVALLARAVAANGSGLLMVSGSNPMADEASLRELVSTVPNPILLFRREQSDARPLLGDQHTSLPPS